MWRRQERTPNPGWCPWTFNEMASNTTWGSERPSSTTTTAPHCYPRQLGLPGLTSEPTYLSTRRVFGSCNSKSLPAIPNSSTLGDTSGSDEKLTGQTGTTSVCGDRETQATMIEASMCSHAAINATKSDFGDEDKVNYEHGRLKKGTNPYERLFVDRYASSAGAVHHLQTRVCSCKARALRIYKMNDATPNLCNRRCNTQSVYS